MDTHRKRSFSDYQAMEDNHTYVPPHMRKGFELWIEEGIHPGGFAMAVLSNDLKLAVGRADHINKNYICSIVAWLYNFAPTGSWGSPEDVSRWSKSFKTEEETPNASGEGE